MSTYKTDLILVETNQHGIVSLRPDLTFGHMRALLELEQSGTDPREFAVQAIVALVQEPELDAEDVREWNDDLLTEMVTTWAERKLGSEWPMSDDLPHLEAFQRGFQPYVRAFFLPIQQALAEAFPAATETFEGLLQQASGLRQALASIGEALQSLHSSLNALMESVIAPLQQNITAIAQSFTLDLQIGSLVESLPDLSEISRRYEGLVKAIEMLDRSGYRFMREQWMVSHVAPLTGIDQIDPRVRDAVITNRLLSLTRDSHFVDELQQLILESPVLSRRWEVIEQALVAHRNRRYVLSIPVLLAQVEGVFTDALILKNMAIRVGNKLCVRDQTGNVKLDRKGQPVMLHGLGQKVQNSRFHNDPGLQDVGNYLTDSLIPERNGILHGSHLAYGRARLSVQLVLAVYVLAAEIDAF